MGVWWKGQSLASIFSDQDLTDDQLFIDYINVVSEVPELLKAAVSSGSSSGRLVELANDLPRLMRLLPALFPDSEDVQQVACLSDMLSALHHLAGHLSLANIVSPCPFQSVYCT
jgi:nuclear pore complex protein Nup98-Nup96